MLPFHPLHNFLFWFSFPLSSPPLIFLGLPGVGLYPAPHAAPPACWVPEQVWLSWLPHDTVGSPVRPEGHTFPRPSSLVGCHRSQWRNCVCLAPPDPERRRKPLLRPRGWRGAPLRPTKPGVPSDLPRGLLPSRLSPGVKHLRRLCPPGPPVSSRPPHPRSRLSSQERGAD